MTRSSPPPSAGLFAAQAPEAPLAERMRPQSLDQVAGQDHVLGPDAPLGRMAARGRVSSLILWGPPGSGKTTIARLLAQVGRLHFEQTSAVFSGVADLKKVFAAARARRADGLATLLFVDEIHRFNRAQQDAFLPVTEDGVIVLVGATTQNPSFELNRALLSRAQVLVLRRLAPGILETLLARAEVFMGRPLSLAPAARQALIAMADGDGRYLLTLAEEVFACRPAAPLTPASLARMLQRRAPAYDKDGEEHYNLISALHKSVRGSDPDAALYWLARMLAGGEEPLYIARRLVRMAVEDIGLADPRALVQANAARQAYSLLGSPEGELALAQAAVYLACAPKSVAVYEAFKAAAASAGQTGSLDPPDHILNAPTALMKDMGRGKGYVYDPHAAEGFSGQAHFPGGMARAQFYAPRGAGFEKELARRLAHWAALRRDASGPADTKP